MWYTILIMEGNKLYRPILRRAWEITWRFKHLWVFGFFAAVLGNVGEYEIISRFVYDAGARSALIDSVIEMFRVGLAQGEGNLLQNFASSIASDPKTFLIILVILVITLAISLFVLWLAVVSQIALVHNIARCHRGEHPTISEGIDSAKGKVLLVAAINILAKVGIYILFALLGWQILFLEPFGIFGRVAFYISYVIFIIAVLLIAFVLKFQMLYVILAGDNFKTAFHSALRLVKGGWLIALEMALIMFIAYIVAVYGFAIAGVTLLVLPFILAKLSLFPLVLVLPVVGIVLILLAILAVMTMVILTAFQWSAWTLLFLRLTAGTEVSKLERIGRTVPRYLRRS